MVQRIAKIIPLPKLWGNVGPIVLARGGFRFDADTPKFLSKSVNLSVRYPLTNFFAQTHVKLKTSFLDVSVLEESGNVLSSTSNFRQYSNNSIRSTDMEVNKRGRFLPDNLNTF